MRRESNFLRHPASGCAQRVPGATSQRLRRGARKLHGKGFAAGWSSAAKPCSQKRGFGGQLRATAELRWSDRINQPRRMERLEALVRGELDRDVVIWARVIQGGQRRVEVARTLGYCPFSSLASRCLARFTIFCFAGAMRSNKRNPATLTYGVFAFRYSHPTPTGSVARRAA